MPPGDGLAVPGSAAAWNRQVCDQVADLLGLEVDLLFFDTTSTYFELDEADQTARRNWRGEKAIWYLLTPA